MRRLLVVALLCLAASEVLDAQRVFLFMIRRQAGGAAVWNEDTHTAAGCSTSQVQAAINAADDNDTVVVPDGDCTWTSGVTISKGIHVKAATVGGVNLTYAIGAGRLFTMNEDPDWYTAISGFDFIQTSGGGENDNVIFWTRTTGGKPMFAFSMTFTGPDVQAIEVQTNRGVIFNNTADCTTTAENAGNCEFLQCKSDGDGQLSRWEAPSTMGMLDTDGTNNLYFEDNSIENYAKQAVDADGLCRIVIRGNTFNNSAVTSHGPDTGPYGNRHAEIYNNAFTYSTGSGCSGPIANSHAAMSYLMFMRGGTWVVHDNSIPNIDNCYIGSSHAEFKYQIQNLTRKSGPMPCYTGGKPMPRQTGYGHNGTAYVSDPIYLWNNTHPGGTNAAAYPGSPENYGPNECGAGTPDISEYLTLGVDIIGSSETGTAKPGYSAYTYPHPLRP